MTREEAIDGLKSLVGIRKRYGDMQTMKDEIECLEMAIKSLDQKPCDDAISKQAVIDMTGLSEWFDSSDSYNKFIYSLNDLPSVTTQSKIGNWIIIDDCEKFIAKCSKCGRVIDSRLISKFPYCRCWTKMEESERKGKEVEK